MRGFVTNKIRFMYLGEEMEKDWHLTRLFLHAGKISRGLGGTDQTVCFNMLERLV